MAGDRKLRIVIDGDATGAVEATDRLGGKLSSFAKGATVALGGAALGFASLGKASVDAASNMAETQSKVAVIFGDQAKAIEAFSSNAAKAFGQSKQQAMDAAAGFATFGKAAGLQGAGLTEFSTKLTGLASDMASFSNTSPEDAIEALGAALRGESEPIRRYGVMLDDATLKAAAMKMGIYNGKGALDAKSKSLAAYQAILDQTKDAQGDFARTSDGLANKQRIMAAQIEDLKVKMGQALLPVVLTVTSAFANLITKLTPIAQHIAEKLGPILEKVVGFVKDNAAPILGALAVVLGGVFIAALVGAVQAVIAFNVALAANPIAIVVLALAGLVAGVIYAYQRFETFRDIVDGVGRFMRDTVLPIMLGFVTTVREGFSQLAGLLNPLWEPIKEAWSTVWSLFAGIFTGHWDVARETAVAALGTVAGWVTDIMQGVRDVWNDLWDSFKNAFGDDGPWGVVRGIAVEGLATVKEWVGGIQTEVGGAWSNVWDFLRGLFDLAWSGVKSTVGGGIGAVWEWVRDIGPNLTTAWSGVWEALSAPFLLAWDGIKEIVQPAIDGLATAFGAISTAVEALIGWLGKISWPEPPDWMKSIIGAGGDVVGGFANWLTGGGNPASAAPAPGASRGGSVVTTPRPGTTVTVAPSTTRPKAPPGMSPGDIITDTNNQQVVVLPDGTVAPLGSSTEGDPGAGGSAGVGVPPGMGGIGAGSAGAGAGLDPFNAVVGAAGNAAGTLPMFDDESSADGNDTGGSPGPEPDDSPANVPSKMKSLLDLIAYTEGTDFGMGHGYHTLLGGTRFESLAKHPNIKVKTKWGTGDAAGRYQFEKESWDWWAGKLGLTDFSAASQDKAASAYIDYVLGRKGVSINAPIADVLKALSGTWTSLPGGKQPAGRTPLAFDKWAELTGDAGVNANVGVEGQYAGLYKNGLHFMERNQAGYRFSEDGLVVTDAINQFALNLKRMQAEGAKTGHKITMFSGFRSKRRQAQLYAADLAENGGKPSGYVAKNSRHSLGIAMDISGDKAWANANAKRFGLWFPISPYEPRFKGRHKEDWHMEPAGSRSWFNAGGYVGGSGPDFDSIPAMLTPGEFVVRRNAVNAIGVDALNAINNVDRSTNVLGPSAREIGAEVARALMAAGAARPITFIDATRSRGDGVSPAARIRQIELLVGAGL